MNMNMDKDKNIDLIIDFIRLSIIFDNKNISIKQKEEALNLQKIILYTLSISQN